MALVGLLTMTWLAGCTFDLSALPTDRIVAAGAVWSVPAAPGASASPRASESRLRMVHTHTGESIDVPFRVGGHPYPEGIAELNHFLRDYRTGDNASYPVTEFDLLHALLTSLDKPNGVIEIICGYRTPATNEYLRSRSADTGVAEKSQHILSHAIDIRVPGVSTARLRDAALTLGLGGVGYYPQSGFVHVDVGPVRDWSFGAAPARSGRVGRNHGWVRHGHRFARPRRPMLHRRALPRIRRPSRRRA